nr:immunoglobulin heavy chain junction region [Macaca mulatta]MOY18511.1 immunoglobulin heavy chain junction region [Macaca mulatta]MOY20001.1 immunoglobulin heavy chain junction region [Macaca mulatta]
CARDVTGSGTDYW